MPSEGSYLFADEWRLGAEVETVWAFVRRLDEWPDWWPSVRATRPLEPARDADDGGPGVGAVWRFTFRTRLPYAMSFDAEVVRIEELVEVEVRVTGRVGGSGRWSVREIPGGTLVHFDWLVTPRLAWMRALSPLARPVFNWNHRMLMVEGGESLAQRLSVPLLAPVRTTASS